MTVSELLSVTRTCSQARKVEVIEENMHELTHELLATFYNTGSITAARASVYAANCVLRAIRIGGKYYAEKAEKGL